MIIGLDVGGTHTDVVLLCDKGLKAECKVATDHEDLFRTVLTGIEKITENIDPETITRIVLSTTLTTNAIAGNKQPEVGMIVSSGPGINPELFRTGRHYYCVSGSVDHRGRETESIDSRQIMEIADIMRKDGIRYVGVAGKFSVRNPSHELKMFELLKDSFDHVFLGHRISGNLSFPRRIATTWLNTVVYPIHRDFFEAVKKSLDQKGIPAPIYILKADGGTLNFDSSIDFPGDTIFSGPSASVMGSLASASGDGDTLVLDIGGTTTDMAILIDGTPVLAPDGIMAGSRKTLIRALQTISIGIGGDSALRIVDGKLRIGPEREGPAMAYGGSVPTPTDALFVLGICSDGDKDKSEKGIGKIASGLGLTIEKVASTILDQACDAILSEAKCMVDAINSRPVYTIHELIEGRLADPKRILVLGGPAPYFAERLQKLSDIPAEAVPKWQVANAIGAALARTTCEVVLFADTQQRIVAAPEENFKETVSGGFSMKNAVRKACDLLEQKAIARGASPAGLEIEIVEEQEFNMVQGFYTAGKNIRVKVQVKPGLINMNSQ